MCSPDSYGNNGNLRVILLFPPFIGHTFSEGTVECLAIQMTILPHAFRNMRPVSRIYKISLPSVSDAIAGAPSQQPLAS